MAITTGLFQTFHRPVVYSYVLGSGEVNSGYIQIFTNPRNIGNLALASTQVYTSGGVDKTANVKAIYTPSYTATSGVILGGVTFSPGSVVSGVLTVTPSAPAFGDIVNAAIVYL